MKKTKLDEKLIAGLNKFNLRARHIVEGFMIGLHKSPYHGFSVEFSDHRQYNVGDPASLIDWKVFAKTDRYYIKRFEEETNLKAYILVDHSASMAYTSHDNEKLTYAKNLAAALAYLMISQQDAVGLASFSDVLTSFVPPKAVRSYLKIIYEQLYSLEASGNTSTKDVLHKIADRIKRRGLVILISDLLDDPAEIISALQHFRHNKNEVIVFHISDAQEIDFDFKRESIFKDAETGEKITVSPWQIRQKYQELFTEHQEFIKQKCFEYKIDYCPITTSTPFDKALLAYLIKRSKLF